MDTVDPTSINDILPAGKQGNFREDYAGPLGLGLPTTGVADSYRELYFPGPEVYWDLHRSGRTAARRPHWSASTSNRRSRIVDDRLARRRRRLI